jgi:hypothetical protein
MKKKIFHFFTRDAAYLRGRMPSKLLIIFIKNSKHLSIKKRFNQRYMTSKAPSV